MRAVGESLATVLLWKCGIYVEVSFRFTLFSLHFCVDIVGGQFPHVLPAPGVNRQQGNREGADSAGFVDLENLKEPVFWRWQSQ